MDVLPSADSARPSAEGAGAASSRAVDEAEALYQTVIRQRSIPEVFLLLGEMALVRQHLVQGSEWFFHTVEAAPSVAEYRVRLGRLCKAQDKLKQALPVIKPCSPSIRHGSMRSITRASCTNRKKQFSQAET